MMTLLVLKKKNP